MLEYRVSARRIDRHGSEATTKNATVALDTDVNGSKWIEVLGRLEALEPEIVVPGHGEIGGVGLIRDVRSYLEDLRARVEAAAATGQSAEEAKAALTPEIRAAYPTWDAEEWIGFAIDCFHADLDG